MATRESRNRHRRHPSISDDDDDDRAAEIEELQHRNHGNRKRRPSLDSSEDDERSEEIKCLQKSGVLPQDFPIVKNLNKYDDDEISREIEELLQTGVISKDVADKMRQNQRQNTAISSESATSNSTDSTTNKITIPRFDGDGIPLNWSRDTPQRARYSCIELNSGDPTFAAINSEFEAANISVTKIERLQNLQMLEKFKAELEQMEKHRSQSFDLNTRYLYHGTTVEKNRICEEGLDQRLSRMGYFGKGIYFSDNPIKCVHYSEDSSGPNEAYILVCRVILGESKVYAPGHYDTTLKREPEKENQMDGWRYYDSVMGCPKDYNEYVVYDNRRAMIEYIISFKIDDTVADQLRKGVTDGNAQTNPSDSSGHFATLSDEDHFLRICEVREAVREKRMEEQGVKYIPPTQDQMQHDREVWARLQKAHGVAPSEVNTDTDTFVGDVTEDCSTSIQHGHHSPPRSPAFRQNSPVTVAAGIGDRLYSDERNASYDSDHDNDRYGEINTHYDNTRHDADAVAQVLSSCIAEFLSVTSLDDPDLAKYYLQRADMDINRAISIYYEDAFDT